MTLEDTLLESSLEILNSIFQTKKEGRGSFGPRLNPPKDEQTRFAKRL